MTLTATYIGKHPDTGAPYYSYVEDDPTKAILVTGPASGDVKLADGTVYAVDREAISIDLAHVDEVHHHIERQHELTGVLDVSAADSPTGEPIQFRHEPCAHCEKKGK